MKYLAFVNKFHDLTLTAFDSLSLVVFDGAE